jgi:hypothetical protein
MSSNSREIPSEWYFITPPQEVAWTKEGQYSQIDTYGTNQPYLQYGMTGLRQLNLGNAMIEGFSNSKQVESNVRDLEACMKMIINGQGGYTSPYCWKVFAGDKMYGTFLITNVSIRETMRDNSGKATRAFADISLHEVSDYQVESGIDLASRAAYSTRPTESDQQEDQAEDAKPVVDIIREKAKAELDKWKQAHPDASEDAVREKASEIAERMHQDGVLE